MLVWGGCSERQTNTKPKTQRQKQTLGGETEREATNSSLLWSLLELRQENNEPWHKEVFIP